MRRSGTDEGGPHVIEPEKDGKQAPSLGVLGPRDARILDAYLVTGSIPKAANGRRCRQIDGMAREQTARVPRGAPPAPGRAGPESRAYDCLSIRTLRGPRSGSSSEARTNASARGSPPGSPIAESRRLTFRSGSPFRRCSSSTWSHSSRCSSLSSRAPTTRRVRPMSDREGVERRIDSYFSAIVTMARRGAFAGKKGSWSDRRGPGGEGLPRVAYNPSLPPCASCPLRGVRALESDPCRVRPPRSAAGARSHDASHRR